MTSVCRVPIVGVEESQAREITHYSVKIIQLNFNMSNLLTGLSTLSCKLLQNIKNRLPEGEGFS